MGTGVVALLGSGETAPGMTRVHRELLAHPREVRAVNLDSAYGFQLNLPDMTEKLVSYFASSLLTTLVPLSLASYAGATDLERTIFKQLVREATFVFAGPGSPSWALAQWRPLSLVDDLAEVLASDGVLCFASAAALTLGAFTAPVYEIYKVGVPEPYWLDGLDLMGRAGLRCAVIPHFDNHEGRNYDTRFCYLGESRLLALESELPEGVGVLGIDEHTALIIDLGARTTTVRGRGNAYWRLAGRTVVLDKSSPTPLDELANFVAPPSPPPTPSSPIVTPPAAVTPHELAQRVSEGGPESLEALARLVHQATPGRDGWIDPTSLVDAVLSVRASARDRGLYELADQLRDALLGAGVDVHDDVHGSTWTLR